MKQLFISLSLLIGFTSVSMADSYDYFPEQTLMAFKGQAVDSGLECYLYITELEFNSDDQADLRYLKVFTNYSHNQPEASETIVTPVRDNLLAGIAMNNIDQIIISYDSSVGVETIQSFALKWMNQDRETLSYCFGLEYLPRQ